MDNSRTIEDINLNYLENKLRLDDFALEVLVTKDNFNMDDLVKDANAIKKILNIKNETDQEIIKYYDNHFIIPEGSEETLISELQSFNYEIYGQENLTMENIGNILVNENMDNKTIILNSIEEKESLMHEVKTIIKAGNYKKLKLNKPLSITTRQFTKKIQNIKQSFIDTYGSALFKKIADWIIEEQNLYQNLDRIERIDKYKKDKVKLQKKMNSRNKLKKFFR